MTVITTLNPSIIELIEKAKTEEKLDAIAMEVSDLIPMEDTGDEWEVQKHDLKRFYENNGLDMKEYQLLSQIAEAIEKKREEFEEPRPKSKSRMRP